LITLEAQLQILKILIAQREENEEKMSRQKNLSHIFTSLKAQRLLISLCIFVFKDINLAFKASKQPPRGKV